MTGGTRNPFDESFEESRGRVPPTATNPFDDNFSGIERASSNQRSDDSFLVNPEDDGDGEAGDAEVFVPEDAAHRTDAEATWQYLGDLPYRRVPIYSNVQWKRIPTPGEAGKTSDTSLWQHGLASFPPSALKHHPKLLEPREVRALLKTTTVTHVKGCPNGGPLAVVTLPVVAGDATHFPRAELRILTNAGQPLAQFDLPPPALQQRYSASDVLTLGFTSRTTLIIVLRDSLCLTYNLRGEVLLPPFFILPRGGEAAGTELLQARVYDGGVAVLAHDKNSALVELFDNHDDNPDYLQSAHLTARKVTASHRHNNNSGRRGGDVNDDDDDRPAPFGNDAPSAQYALITPLPTAEHASRHFCSFLALAVLSRTRTSSRHPEVFLSTSDNSVVVVEAASLKMTDVDTRARIGSPVVDMSFAPNGRFLACFTESCMLTVTSTSFETKVLDFDTSEGSSSPLLEMQWCGEDRYVIFLLCVAKDSPFSYDICLVTLASLLKLYIVLCYTGRSMECSWLGPTETSIDFVTKVRRTYSSCPKWTAVG